MLLIIITSMVVSIGSYLLRKGNFFGFFLMFFQNNSITSQELLFTISGIIVNLIGIILWQLSAKTNVQYQVAWPMYLSLSLIFGSLFASLLEKTRLEINFFVGTALIIGGIIILIKK